jgi:hypothetical protein
MHKNQPILNQDCEVFTDIITMTSQEFRDTLGLQLPKTAVNYRSFWENPKNRKRVQSLIGLPSSYTCNVRYKERVVVFTKRK